MAKAEERSPQSSPLLLYVQCGVDSLCGSAGVLCSGSFAREGNAMRAESNAMNEVNREKNMLHSEMFRARCKYEKDTKRLFCVHTGHTGGEGSAFGRPPNSFALRENPLRLASRNIRLIGKKMFADCEKDNLQFSNGSRIDSDCRLSGDGKLPV